MKTGLSGNIGLYWSIMSCVRLKVLMHKCCKDHQSQQGPYTFINTLSAASTIIHEAVDGKKVAINGTLKNH